MASLLKAIDTGDLLRAASWIGKQDSIPQVLANNALAHLSRLPTRIASAKLILQLTRQLVVLHNADLHQENELALRQASKTGNSALIQFLLVEGADIHAAEDEAFRNAVQNHHISLIHYLIKKGAKVDTRNNAAMKYAIQNRHTDTIQILLKAGVKDSLVLRNYDLTETEKQAFALFFTAFCEAVEVAPKDELFALRFALLEGSFYPPEDDSTTHRIKYGDRKALCAWMQIRLFVEGTDCSNDKDPLTAQNISQIPFVYLWSTIHPLTGEKLCFDILSLFHYVEKWNARSQIRSVPIPLLGDEGKTATYFTPDQIHEIEVVYGARMRLFWKMRDILM